MSSSSSSLTVGLLYCSHLQLSHEGCSQLLVNRLVRCSSLQLPCKKLLDSQGKKLQNSGGHLRVLGAKGVGLKPIAFWRSTNIRRRRTKLLASALWLPGFVHPCRDWFLLYADTDFILRQFHAVFVYLNRCR